MHWVMYCCVELAVSFVFGYSSASAFGGQLDGTAETLIRSAVDDATRFQHVSLSLVLNAQVVEASLTKAEIDKQLAEHLKALDSAIEANAAYPDMVSRLREARASGIQGAIDQIKANQNRSILFNWRSSGPWFGGDRLVEFRVKRGSEEKYSTPTFLLNRVLDEHRVQNIILDAANRFATVSSNHSLPGIGDPALNGRLPIAFHDDTSFRFTMADVAAAVVSDEYPDLKSVSVFSRKSDVEVARIGLVVIDGQCLCPLIELLDKSGVVVQRLKASDYFESQPDGVLYPGKWRSEATGAEVGSMVASTVITVDQAASRIGGEASSGPLRLPLTAGTSILVEAARELPRQDFITTCDVLIGIDDVSRLSSLPCIGISKIVAQVPSTPVQSNTRYRWFVGANVLLMITGFLLWRAWRKSKTNGARVSSVIVLAVGLTTTAGCHRISDETPADDIPAIVLDSPTTDLGVKSAGEVVPFKIAVRASESGLPVVVDAKSGCNCLDVSPAHFTLEPGALQVVNGSISTHGRKGAVETGISFLATDAAGGVTRQIGSIRLVVQDDLFSLPSRMKLTENKHGGYSGNVTLYTPVEWRERIACQLVELEGSVLMSPSDAANCTLVEVSLPRRPDDAIRLQVAVLLLGQTEPIMRIPVLLE